MFSMSRKRQWLGTLELSGSRNVLSEVIDGIRRRWRLRLALRGLDDRARGCVTGSVLVGSGVMQWFHFDALSVVGVRTVTYVVLVVLAIRYVILPLRRYVSDVQVALYLE